MKIFRFDRLTWPEVAQLPRDTPLVVPLGNGYPLERLASRQSAPRGRRPEQRGVLVLAGGQGAAPGID